MLMSTGILLTAATIIPSLLLAFITALVALTLGDGLELAARIHEVDPSLPVLFVTGELSGGDARAAGIVEKELLVRKPFSPKQLIDLVEARIRRF